MLFTEIIGLLRELCETNMYEYSVGKMQRFVTLKQAAHTERRVL
jgi:hypothetical protein